MKKRGFFFVALGLTAATMAYAADQNYTDLGTAQTLEVTEDKLSDAQVNTGSTVTVITREQIENYHAESTADLLEKAIGVSRQAYGPIGAETHSNIRGMGTERTLVYIDGSPVGRAYYGVFDLSSMPASVIDHIEIIKTGSGDFGNIASAGGIINIITKQASENDTKHYTLSFGNGSYLPKEYKDGTNDERNWRGLLDVQNGDFTYTNNIDGVGLLMNVGGYYADNGYTYEGTSGTYKRENAEAYDIHGNVNLNGSFGNNGTWRSNNMMSYQNFNVPGKITDLSPNNNQKNFTFNTSNQVIFSRVTLKVSEEFNKLKYHQESSYGITNSENNSNSLTIDGDYEFAFSDDFSMHAGGEFAWDYLDTTSFTETKNRVAPKAYANGSLYFLDGKLGFYPMLSIAYISDYEKVVPNATLGVVYSVVDPLVLNASLSYVGTAPKFYQLYDTYMGNEDLDMEQAYGAEVGGTYTLPYFSYTASVFTKYIKDAITLSPTWTYVNINDSFYAGTEQSIEVYPTKGLTLSASYLLNKSYDLSGDYGFSDDIWVTGIRMNTAKLGVSYKWDILTFSFDANYYGKYKYFEYGATSQSEVDDFWVCNTAVSADIIDDLNVYVAIDNLFDKDYQLSNDYPMPGMKIRLGGTWKF